METKKCSRCGEVKGVEEFYKDKRRSDGLYPSCKKCHNARTQSWKDHHKDKVLEDNRKYVRAHPEIYRTASNRYKHNNPGANCARVQKRRARLRGASGSFTAQEFLDLCERYGNRCLCCGRGEVKLTADHIVPLDPGTNDISNIQPLCGPCNSSKRRRTIDYRPLTNAQNAL